MNNLRCLFALTAIYLGSSSLSAAQETAVPPSPAPDAAPPGSRPAFADQIRVSAMISFSGGVKVGFTDTADNQNFFLGIGETKYGLELLSADFEKETVVVRKNEATWTLNLAKDPNAPPMVLEPGNATATAEPVFRGEGIENFLRDHPEAVIKGTFPVLQPPPPDELPVQGKGEAIEKFLNENPEMRAVADRPAEGKGETIEQFLRENPDIAAQADRPVEGMGEGIESKLRENPELEIPDMSAPEISPEPSPEP